MNLPLGPAPACAECKAPENVMHGPDCRYAELRRKGASHNEAWAVLRGEKLEHPTFPQGPEKRADNHLTPSQQLLRYFANEHLPEPLREISSQCAWLATNLDEMLPDGPEKTMGLRKLLEAKDCFVRAALPPAPAYPLIPKEES